MKKILILCRQDERETYDNVRSFSRSLTEAERKCSYSYGQYEDLLFYYDGTTLRILLEGKTDILEFDGVFLIGWFKTKILEDIALCVAKHFDHHGKKIFNTETLYTRSRSKLSQYVIASQNDVSLVPFLFSANQEVLSQALKTIWQDSDRFIMKGVLASRGNDNYLVNGVDDGVRILEKTDNETGPWFIVQQFIPNDGDYRILVVQDEVKAVMHRQSQTESHLNNTSKGGSADWHESTYIPAEVCAQAVRLSKALRREISGIDMIMNKDTGSYYLLESNNMPQLATGKFVDQKLSILDDYFASS